MDVLSITHERARTCTQTCDRKYMYLHVLTDTQRAIDRAHVHVTDFRWVVQ